MDSGRRPPSALLTILSPIERSASAPYDRPPDRGLFHVPQDLVRILDRDLAAGIAKTHADGRTVDVHSLRHTFATLLSKAGVLPRMAQELMRHSDIRLTTCPP